MKINPKTAIVYDWVNQIGGAERMVELIAKIFPNSDLYTAVANLETAPWAKQFLKITPSFIDKFPFAKKNYHWYYPLLPAAFESFNFNSYDLVISITSYPGKFIITHPETCHICYCLTPPRFLWERNNLPKILGRFSPLHYRLRIEDQLAASRPDYLFTTCKNTAHKIGKVYRRKPDIVYPGVDTKKFFPLKNIKTDNYFLIVSRLVEYKKVDLAIQAFNALGWPLKVIGVGRKEKKLKASANKNIEFLGKVDDKTLVSHYQNCQAVIFPQEEDFGLVPIEAQACGRPVIAYNKGGATETIIEGITGEFFSFQNPASLIELLKSFDQKIYKPENCRKNSLKFREEDFLKIFKERALERFNRYRANLSRN